MLEVTELYVYPVKSLRGIRVDSIAVINTGFEYDRRWMLVDNSGLFLSQRKCPKMALVNVAMGKEALVVSVGGRKDLHIPYNSKGSDVLAVSVWGDTCDALAVSEEADSWFSEYLGQSCRLVRMPDDFRRPVDPDYARRREDVASFADGFPVLLVSEASLADLNSRLEDKGGCAMSMIRFRPNIVVRGCGAYAEDRMDSLEGEQLDLYPVKPCSRCVIPAIDPETGEKEREPLDTLTEYRRLDGKKVYFGQNVLIQARREKPYISTGDCFRVT